MIQFFIYHTLTSHTTWVFLSMHHIYESFVGVEDEPRENEDGAADAVTMAKGGGEDRDGFDWTRAQDRYGPFLRELRPGGICDVYIVGTTHVSQDSCQEVKAVISCLKPEVVFLELCASRVAVLNPQNLKVPTMDEMVELWKKKHNAFGIIYSWSLAKVAQKLEVLPWSAYEEAMKYGGKSTITKPSTRISLTT